MTQLEPRYDRPPEGLARGRWDAPAWFIALFGGAIVLGALGFVLWRARRERRGRR